MSYYMFPGHRGPSRAAPPSSIASNSHYEDPHYGSARPSHATTAPSGKSRFPSSNSSFQAASTVQDLPACPHLGGTFALKEKLVNAAGGFSDIYVATYTPQDGSRIKVAIKVTRDIGEYGSQEHTEKLRRRIARESATWKTFTHPNVVHLFGLYFNPTLSPKFSGFVCPWYKHGNALEFVRKHPKTQRVPLIEGIARGLQYIHSLDAVHGDIKSANVLISDDYQPLISDFGCSKFLKIRGFTTDLKTSVMYLAPELIALSESDQVHVDIYGKRKRGTPTTKESDIWAFGMVGAEILGGEEVFTKFKSNQYNLALHIKNRSGRPQQTDFPALSREADSFWPVLQQCWRTDPGNRPTMDTVLSWIRKPQ